MDEAVSSCQSHGGTRRQILNNIRQADVRNARFLAKRAKLSASEKVKVRAAEYSATQKSIADADRAELSSGRASERTTSKGPLWQVAE